MASSWNRVQVYGTWLEQDGTLKAGTYKVEVPVRVTSDTDDVIIPAGVFATGPLSVQPDSKSFNLAVPATDDPDINETGWKVIVTIKFTSGGEEKYYLDVPLANRPTADGGNNLGVNLEKYVFPTNIPQSNPLFKIGVAGGLAKLNLDGLVVNADGSVAGGLSSVEIADIEDASTLGKTLLAVANAGAARTAIGAGTSSFDGAYASLSGKPTLFDGAYASLSGKPTIPDSYDDIGAASAAQGDLADTAVQPTRTIAGKPLSANISLVKGDVGLGNVDNTTDLLKPVSNATSSALSGKADLVGGVIPTAQLPAIAIVEYLGTSANQAAMLAKTGQLGDWTIRTDLGTTWLITGSDPTQLSNWTALSYPTAPVTSVSGRTGVITLAKADVGLGSVDNTADSAKSVASAATLTTARLINGVSFNGSANVDVLGLGIFNATSKTTPVDGDSFGISDSAASNGAKKVTFVNLRAALKLSNIGAPTASVSMNSQKITSLADGVAGTDGVNVNQLDDKLDADGPTVTALVGGTTKFHRYGDGGTGWTGIPVGPAADPNVDWVFLEGTDADVPTDALVAGDWIWLKVPE